MAGAPSWPLVGRGVELQQIARARAEGRSAIVIHGPSGIGKSRLAREVLAGARQTAEVAWVQATRSSTGLALGAFAALLPTEIRSDDALELLQRGVQALKARAGGRPLVLGVDDAQWLDPTSATLVLNLAMTGTVFVVATVRSNEPCPDAVVALWKDAGAQRIELGVLTETETGDLAEKIVGGPIDRATRHWVWTTSRGNALYVRELMLGAVAGGALEQVSGLWRLPAQAPVSASLTELVSARMAGLSDPQQLAMDLLSLGEPLRLAELLALVGSEALMGAEARGLVSVDGASADAEVRLAHPLYGEVIRGALGTLRARDIRLQLVDIIRARQSPGPQDALRLARWLLDAEEPLPTDLALQAGRAAILAGDPDFAASLAQLALRADESIEARLLLARAHTVRRRFTEAAAVLDEAEPYIATPQEAWNYLEQQSEVLQWGLRRPAQLSPLLDRAAGWWPDPAWQVRIAALRLRVASFERLGAGVVPSAEFLTSADVEPDVRDEFQPVHFANLFYSGRALEALELARRARPTPPLRTLNDAIALSLWSRIVVETGEDWPALEEWMTAALVHGVRTGEYAAAGQAAYSLAILRQAGGRYIDASALLAEAEVQLEHNDPVGLLPVIAAAQLELACQRDDPTALDELLLRFQARLGDAEPLGHQMPYVVRAQAWTLHAQGDPARAQRLMLAAAEELSPSPVHSARMTYEALRAGASVRRLVADLEEQSGRSDARLVALYAAHAKALAADDGPALLAVADDMEQIGALRYATEAAAHASDAFARRGRDDSARRAASRSRELHARGNGSPPPVLSGINDALVALTAREQQLAALAAQGFSNAEIAERLVLSIRTVESHLYRAMQKLGITDRRDLRRSH